MIKKLAVCAVFTAGILSAQASKVGIINLQQAVLGTQEGKAAVARLQREFVEPRTKQLETIQNEINTLTDTLQRGGNTMSETAKADMQFEIDQKTRTFNRAVEDYQADSESEQRKLLGDLSSKMQGVISQYVRANGFTVVLDSANPNSGLVWADPDQADITAGVIAAYDQAHPAAAAPAAPPAAASPAATPDAGPPPAAPVQPGTPPAAAPAKP